MSFTTELTLDRLSAIVAEHFKLTEDYVHYDVRVDAHSGTVVFAFDRQEDVLPHKDNYS